MSALDLDGKYVTEAVESGVFAFDGEEIGHVCLLDLDDSTLEDAQAIARSLGGIAVVLESSERSHHVWGLSIRSLSEWIEDAISIEGVDEDHVALSDRRGCGVLRIDAKRSATTGDVVTPAPRFRSVEISPSDLAHSGPHLSLLTELTTEIDVDELEGRVEWVGDRLERRVYMADIGGRRSD